MGRPNIKGQILFRILRRIGQTARLAFIDTRNFAFDENSNKAIGSKNMTDIKIPFVFLSTSHQQNKLLFY